MRATILLLGLVIATAARSEDLKEAQVHFEEGAKAYELRDYDRAINEYKLSYTSAAKPLTLYALGQTFRARGDLEAALHFYQQYLVKSPKGKYRAVAEEEVQKLESLIEQKRTTQTGPPHGVPATGPSEPSPQPATPLSATTRVSRPIANQASTPPTLAVQPWFRKPVGWVLVAGGVALLGVGGGLYGGASSADDDGRRAGTLQEQLDAQDQAVKFRGASYALLGIGAAVAVAGIIVFAVPSRSRTRASFALNIPGAQ